MVRLPTLGSKNISGKYIRKQLKVLKVLHILNGAVDEYPHVLHAIRVHKNQLV